MKRKPLFVLVACALQQMTCSAAEGSTPNTTDRQLPTVTVEADRDAGLGYVAPTASSATKIDAPLRDIPQTVNVIPQQVIRDQGARSLETVLKSVPGVGLSHGDGQRDQVTIRGFSAIADQFVDGLRDDALYFRDLSNIEQVEVLKGPASVLYGRGSSGGLINRITKKPGIDKSEATLTVGSFDQRRGEFDLARKNDATGVAFRITGAIERADSYREQQFLNREAIAPSLEFQLGGGTTLLLQAEYLSDERVTDFGIPAYQGRPVDVPRETYYGAANAREADTSRATVKAGGFTLTHRFDDTLTLRNAFRHYDFLLDRANTLVGSVNETARTASLTHGNVVRDERGYFNQTELTQKLKVAGMQHQLLYGLELGRQYKDQVVRSRANVATVPLFDPVNPVLPRDLTTAPSADNLALMTTSGVYFQDLLSLSTHWKALAGVRYDRFKQEVRERRAGQPDLSRTDNAWSPRAGLVYQPALNRSYYVSYSKSFQPSGETFALATSNAQIEPEQTTNKEIGAKFDFLDGMASATAALFELERTNIKSTVPGSSPTVVLPIGTQRTRGLELTFSGELPRGWQVWSGYAYLDARVTDSVAIDAGRPVLGKRATLTPRHSANLWVAKQLGNGWRAGAGINLVGDRAANPGNTVTLPGYATMDAMVSWRVAKFDLQLNINNLFDRKYIVSGHGTSPNLNLPGAPRNAQLTARYSF